VGPATQDQANLTRGPRRRVTKQAQLVSKIGERYSLPHAQAQADVMAWMEGKTF